MALPHSFPRLDRSRPRRLTGPAGSVRAERARWQFVALCIAFLLLGTADLIRVSVTEVGPLRANAVERQRAVDLLPAAPATPAAAADSTEAAAAQQREMVRTTHHAAIDAVRRGWGRLGGQLLALLVTAGFLIARRRRHAPVSATISATMQLVFCIGLILLASRLLIAPALPTAPAWGLLDLVLLHGVACILIPWSPRASLVPVVPLLIAWGITVVAPAGSETDRLDRLVGIVIAPIAFGPALAFAGLRLRRRYEEQERVELGARLRSVDDEFSRARTVHDAMFPHRFSGRVGFEYEYHPMQELGGDFVHVHACPETERTTLTLLDVAGHGLAAALTVNRLFGELERIRAEDADADPAQVMVLLNRYIYLTMARHSLFATGACIMLDPADGTVRWVNAGHPPAFVRRAGGGVTDLETTTMLLGVESPDAFEPHQAEARMAPGDMLLAYTDGAFEARDAAGKRFGIARLRETLQFDPPPRNWPRFVAGAVAQHHGGAHDDDVLIAALTLRSLSVPAMRPAEMHSG